MRAWARSLVVAGMLIAVETGCGGSGDGTTENAVSICALGQFSMCRCADGVSNPANGCIPSGMSAIATSAGTSGSLVAGVSGSLNAGSSASNPLAGGLAGAPAGGSAGGPQLGAAGVSGAAGVAGASVENAGFAAGAGTAASAAGSGGAASGPSDASDFDCGEDGTVGKASNQSTTPAARGYGSVTFMISAGNQITRLQTTLAVPAKPKPSGTIFIWPGLQPLQGDNFQPVGNGVLQPVLTWGTSCAPNAPSSNLYKDWWISSQYVNLESSDSKHHGCFGGKIMSALVDDALAIDMSLEETTWSQVVTDTKSGAKVDFDIDMLGQPQRWAIFDIELPTSAKPVADVVYTNTVITLAKPEPKACQASSRGTTDYFSAPVSSSDGLRCCISRIVLRAQGVAATTKDP